MSDPRDDAPPRPSKRPPEAPRPSKRPAAPEAPRASKRPAAPPEAPRPSKRPPQPQPPRPSKRPPQHAQHNPSIPRAPRLPGDGRPQQRPPPRDARRGPPLPPQRAPQPQPPPRPPPPERRVSLPLVADVSESDALREPEFPEYAWPENATLTGIAMVRTGDATRAIAVDSGNLTLHKGESVVIESDRGVDLAVVSSPPRRQLVTSRPVYRVARRANDTDLRAESKTRLREAEAVRTSSRLVHELKLDAKVVRAECSLNGGRIVVYLSSEDRVELRDLARDLTQALRTRVELRHLGPRDAAKVLGGVGPCGLQLCCNTFLADFAPVSIRHAKDQGLALNAQRISGVCGRLMCCLVYEDAFYRQQRALFPKPGKRVTTARGEGRVRDVDVLARTVRVLLTDGGAETFPVDEVKSVHAPDPGAPAATDED